MSIAQNILGLTKAKAISIVGGDISESYKLTLHGKEYFLKVGNSDLPVDLYEKEKLGLALLKFRGVPVPNDVKTFTSECLGGLVMDYIATAHGTKNHMQNLGKVVAHMHSQSCNLYGLEYNNYIGKLPQCNEREGSWITFYIEHRLMSQIKLAFEQGLLGYSDVPLDEDMEDRLQNIMPTITPALLHGDLWSGNYLCAPLGRVFLIDPAVYYGHHEVDIAMTLLFGGFTSEFYDQYFEIFPKEAEWESRKDIYQLYYLLVHLNLFGRSYYDSVSTLLHKYFK